MQNKYIYMNLQYPPIDYVSCCYMCTTCSKLQGLVCYCIVTAPCIIFVLTSLGNKMGEGEATHPHQQSSSSARASSQQHPKPRNYDSSANIYQTLKPAVHQEHQGASSSAPALPEHCITRAPSSCLTPYLICIFGTSL